MAERFSLTRGRSEILNRWRREKGPEESMPDDEESFIRTLVVAIVRHLGIAVQTLHRTSL